MQRTTHLNTEQGKNIRRLELLKSFHKPIVRANCYTDQHRLQLPERAFHMMGKKSVSPVLSTGHYILSEQYLPGLDPTLWWTHWPCVNILRRDRWLEVKFWRVVERTERARDSSHPKQKWSLRVDLKSGFHYWLSRKEMCSVLVEKAEMGPIATRSREGDLTTLP